MSKTIAYVLVLALVASGAMVVLFGGLDEDTEAETEAPAVAEVAPPIGALASLREAEYAVLETRAEALTHHPDIMRFVDPARAMTQRMPVLKPGQPPMRSNAAVMPSEEELRGPAQAVLDARANEVRATLAIVDAKSGEVAVSASAQESVDVASLVEAVHGQETAAKESKRGVLSAGGRAYNAITSPLNNGTHWLLIARPLDDAALSAYAASLGAASSVTLVRRGELVASSADGDARSALEAAATGLRTTDALQSPPESFTETQLGEDEPVRQAVHIEPTLDAADSATALVLSVPRAATGGGEDAPATIAPGPLDDPAAHSTLWLAGLGGFVLLVLIGVVIARSDRESALQKMARRLQSADRLDHVTLRGAESEVVEAVQALTPQMATTGEPDPATTSKLKEAEAQIEQLRLDLEAQESRAAQLNKQIGYAREQVTTAQEKAEAASKKASAAQRARTELEGTVETLRRQLEEARAAAERTSVSPAVTPEDDADELFASALESLETAERAKSTVDSPAVPETEETFAQTQQMPAAKRPDATAEEPSSDGEKKEYDTAELAGEEMSQLLDEIDTRTTGEYDEIKIPGEAYPSEEIPDLGGSLEDLADRIGEMSDSQVRKLQAASEAREAEERIVSEAEGNSTSPGRPGSGRTAQLFSVDRAAERPSTDTNKKVGRQTLPGGLRVQGDDSGEGEEEQRAVAPPPWKKSDAPPRSLSPAGLLEALKKRGQKTTEPPEEGADEDESTRVSRFSRGLLDKTPVRKTKPKSVSQSGLFSRTGSRVDIDPTNDSEYFKSLYEDFVDTKKRCGESVEKITLERFVNRLARNKKALMERYECRTVRFQVYVKEGRAALKATPVK